MEEEEEEDEGGGGGSGSALKPFRIILGPSGNRIQGINWDTLLICLLDSQL